MPPAKKKRRPATRSQSSLVETEAVESGSRGSPREGDEDETTNDDNEEEQRGFIDDRSQPRDTPMSHVALDNRREDSEPVIIVPYFPRGLAKSTEQPLDFNFTLYLYDTLRLPLGLFPDDQDQEVLFEDLQQCMQYCWRYATQRQDWMRDHPVTQDHSQERRAQLSKETIFREAGQPLGVNMTTGNALFDRNLADLRLDVFGNVMFLKAPHWSDVSVQFMHGFPRRLIAHHHRGLLRGNITVAARISNQAVRSLSAGDIAAFVSQKMVQGLGLTTSELMMARASAIKYAGQREKPTRLLDLTVRFGIDFLTLAPVPRDKLQDLRRKSTVHWNGVLETSADEDQEAELSSSSDESGLSVDWDPREESQGMPATDTDAYTVAVTRHVENLLHCYVSTRQMVTQQLEVRAATARPSGSSGMSRRRKQQTPRRKPAASRQAPEATATATTTVSSRDQERGNIEQREPEQQEQPRQSPREILVALPGIVATRIPNEDSLQRLEQFLRKNQPCDPQRAAQATEEGRESIEEARQRAARNSYEEQRAQQVQERIKDFWRACQADCTCLGESAVRDSQDNNDQNCPYCISTDEGADVARVTGRCLNADCKVCALMNKLDKVSLAALGEVRNTRLAVMLDLAPFIAQCLNSGDVAEERRQVLVRTFCELLCCSKSRLRFLANVGFLVMICPRLKHLRLERGWGDVWCNLSKFATAIGYHQDHHSQLAALIFMRQRCIPDSESKWAWYFQSEDPEEQRVNREVFEQRE